MKREKNRIQYFKNRVLMLTGRTQKLMDINSRLRAQKENLLLVSQRKHQSYSERLSVVIKREQNRMQYFKNRVLMLTGRTQKLMDINSRLRAQKENLLLVSQRKHQSYSERLSVVINRGQNRMQYFKNRILMMNKRTEKLMENKNKLRERIEF